MDNLTHGLTGAGVGLLLAHEALGVVYEPAILVTAILASQLPDFDVLIGGRNKTSYLKHHRGFTHSLLLSPLVSLVLASMVSIFSDVSFMLLFLSGFFSLTLHIVLDIFNAYGTKALWPLCHERFAWDVLMVVDPSIIVMFVIGIGAYLLGYQPLLYALYPGLMLYILAMTLIRSKARRYLQSVFENTKQEISIMPPMLGWRKWNFIVAKNNRYYLGKINISNGKIKIMDMLVPETTCTYVEGTKNNPEVQVFLEFARFPWHTKIEDGEDIYIQWSDLRYKLREKEHFTICIKSIQ